MTEEELRNNTADGGTPDMPVQPTEVSADSAEQAEVESDALMAQLAQMEATLGETEKKAAEYLDGWQRSQAAFANFRKRTEAEQAQYRLTANAQLLSRLLPILDDFKRAFEMIPEAFSSDPWLDGIRLVERKVKSVLEAESVTPIALKPGDLFDPGLHEAVLCQEVEGFNDGEVVAELETGYMIGDRILRPSLVVVAKGPAAPQPPVEEVSTPPDPNTADSTNS